MVKIEYNCPKCQEDYIIQDFNVKTEKQIVPKPDSSILMRKFQDHDDHTIFLHFDGNELKNYQIVPQLRSVFDTLLYDNIQVASIINTLIFNENHENRYLLLYITKHQSYSNFFKEISKIYVNSVENATIRQEAGMMVISLSNIDFVLADFDVARKILKDDVSSITSLDHIHETNLRSLLIDTSITNEKKLLKMVKKSKFKLDPEVKLILAFDSRKIDVPPLNLRDYFLDKQNIKSVELLNFQDTNGLKSIFLRSYYNILDDPTKGREAFEIMQKKY